MPRFAYLAFLVMASLISSCAWEKDLPEGKSFVARLKTGEKPNQYAVELEWPNAQESSAWVIQRQGNDPGPKPVVTLGGEVREYVDGPVSAGITYKYSLAAMNGGTYGVIEEQEIQIPRDFVVDQDVLAEGIEGYNRLFLTARGRLYTYGRQTQIAVEEIISNDGVIETFPETARAIYGVAGRPGGKLNIKAKIGRGMLRILARGEAGGTGAQGDQGAVGFTGRNGSNGECLHTPRYHPERGGITGYDDSCRSQTENGVQGGKGYQGKPGKAGLPGGDSAEVLVRIEDPSQIKVSVEPLPGLGGYGGSGGVGGAGGPGGRPGQTACNECRQAYPGLQGAPGDKGPSGPLGPNGKIRPICLSLGTAKFGDCEAFQY